ncbi:MAG: metalloregulator ArsR/SmtB family transcription factor [Gemmatimonadaceae bacterium]
MKTMNRELLELVADRFRALSDPARLRLLNELRDGERSVTELVEATALGQANVSKHLSFLHQLGYLKRRKEGLFTYYALADREIFRLCDIMCGRIEAEAAARRKALR